MNIKFKAGAVATILLTALFVLESEVYSQEAAPSPTPAARKQAPDKARVVAKMRPRLPPSQLLRNPNLISGRRKN